MSYLCFGIVCILIIKIRCVFQCFRMVHLVLKLDTFCFKSLSQTSKIQTLEMGWSKERKYDTSLKNISLESEKGLSINVLVKFSHLQ